MFKKHQGRRHTNIVFVIFRLILSVVMFAILTLGIYSAYKHFSGLDPFKLDPVAVIKNIISARTPKQFTQALPSFKNPKPANKEALFKFLLVADSHADNVSLTKAIEQAKSDYPDLKFIIGLGDYSDVGIPSQLKSAKAIFDASNLRYFLIPGDHDLWDCRNRSKVPVDCFKEVFGPPYQSFTFENFEFLLLDNSDNYLGMGEEEKRWIENEFEKLKENSTRGIFVFIHEPLFHPSSDHVMGKVESSLKEQARDLMFQFKNAGVKKVFAGDTHLFSQYSEPVTNLSMVTIGAVTIEKNPQAPRFAVVSVLEDGSIKVEDVIILGI